MATLPDGIQLSKINPKYLHTNSTSHVWAFGAFAELIDNAYDPDVGASSLVIDIQKVGTVPCLILLDNGAGMDKEKLIKMLSFGYCDKGIYNRRESYKPVGLYGNGFKSGSMRLGKDALVFSRCDKSACIGFLSQTYLEAIGADSVIVPLLEYSLPDLKRNNNRQHLNNLEAILQYSEFKSEASLKEELNSLKSSLTGTKIFIFNLHRLQSGKGELDFLSDRKDIRCPDPYMEDTTNVDNRPINDTPEYKISLREYCSILYLRPRMKIIIRGHPVKSKYISKMLCQTEDDKYKPSWMKRNDKPIEIKIGFSCEKDSKENYGLMLYHKNRLMKAYERVGYQKQANERGVGVIGVVELDFITPTHNKQDFNRDNHFNSIMAGLAGKLNAYWNRKKEIQNNDVCKLPDWTWAQCDNCLLWRRLPAGTDGDSLPKHWFCRMNKDAQYNRCFEEEESDAPVDTPRQKRANNKRNTETLSEGDQSSTATESIPKRNKMAVKSSAAGSKPLTRSKSPKAKKLGKSPNLKVSNKSKTRPQKNTQTSTSQSNNTNSVDRGNSDDDSDGFEGTSSGTCRRPVKKNNATNSVDRDNSDDDSDGFEGTSSGTCRRPVKKTNATNSVDRDNSEDDSDAFESTSSGSSRKPVKNSNTTSSSPLLRVSMSLFNVNKSSDRIQSNDEDLVANHSSMEQEEGQVLIRHMGNGVHTAVQTDQLIVCEAGIQTDIEVVTRPGSIFHQNVHKLLSKMLTGDDLGDVNDIESMVSNILRADTL